MNVSSSPYIGKHMQIQSFIDNISQVLDQPSFRAFTLVVCLGLIVAMIVLMWLVVTVRWPAVGITAMLSVVVGRVVWAGIRGR